MSFPLTTPSWRSLFVLLSLVAVPGARGQALVAENTLPDAPQQQTPPPAKPADPAPASTATPPKDPTQVDTAIKPAAPTSAEVLKREEKQRILGVVPNFNTVESAENIPPLTAKQKFQLMFKISTDPFIFVTARALSLIVLTARVSRCMAVP